MRRSRACIAGVYVVIFLFAGPLLVDTISQTFQTVLSFPVSAIRFPTIILAGYISYRIFWGTSDDPRHHWSGEYQVVQSYPDWKKRLLMEYQPKSTSVRSENEETREGGWARPKAAGLRPAPVEVRGFKSLPSHFLLDKKFRLTIDLTGSELRDGK